MQRRSWGGVVSTTGLIAGCHMTSAGPPPLAWGQTRPADLRHDDHAALGKTDLARVKRVDEEHVVRRCGRSLRFLVTPGHCPGHIVTCINSRLAHLGDLVIHTSDGRPALPYAGEGGSVETDLDENFEALNQAYVTLGPEANLDMDALYSGIVWKLTRTPGVIQRPIPGLDDDNRYVYQELLGLSETSVRELRGSGVI